MLGQGGAASLWAEVAHDRTNDANFVVEGDDLVLARPVFEADAASFDTGPHQVAIDCDPSLRVQRDVMKPFQIVAGGAPAPLVSVICAK